MRSVGRAHSSTALTFLGSARTCPFSTMWLRNSTEFLGGPGKHKDIVKINHNKKVNVVP